VVSFVVPIRRSYAGRSALEDLTVLVMHHHLHRLEGLIRFDVATFNQGRTGRRFRR